MVPGGMRNIHENKVSGQMSSNSANHHADRHGSNEEYMNIVHRLGSEVRDGSVTEQTKGSFGNELQTRLPSKPLGSLVGLRGKFPFCFRIVKDIGIAIICSFDIFYCASISTVVGYFGTIEFSWNTKVNTRCCSASAVLHFPLKRSPPS